jgi:VWFA-related protein
VLALAAPPSARAQVETNLPGAGFGPPPTQPSTGQPAPTTPTLNVYSRETIVDVLVTDDKGQPVRGLTRSDFTVEEDAKPQPIRSFYEYDKQAPPAPARTLPPNTYTNSTTLPASGPAQIFLFDLLGARPEDMERSKKYVADYLRSMPAGTQVALFEFSHCKGLLLVHDFTTDGHAAAAAVDNLDVEWIHNPCTADPIAYMNQIAAHVAAIHGRKNLVWIVQGMPLPIMHDGGLSWGVRDMIAVHRLMDLYDRFTREQIAIYPLDPRGAHGLGRNPVEQLNALMEQKVADEIGGAISNSNDYQSTIANLVDDTLHGYTLSFIPPRATEDGHYHPIKITVDRSGLHLNYRPGYNDEQPNPPDPKLIHDMIQGSHAPWRDSRHPDSLRPARAAQLVVRAARQNVRVQPRAPQTKGAPYDTVFTFDPTQIALAETPDGVRTASIELDLGAYDFYGTLVAARSQTFKITVTPAQYNSFYRTPLKFSLAIDLPHGQLTLRAGVFDTSANKAGTLEIPLTVPKK